MNFTPEYIELCKDEKVQELRLTKNKSDYYRLISNEGDWFDEKDKGIFCSDIDCKRNHKYFIWLPTGDDLDFEICKLLAEMSKDGEDLSYDIGVSFHDGQISAWQITGQNRDCEHEEMEIDRNLAKLKFLIQLLEGE